MIIIIILNVPLCHFIRGHCYGVCFSEEVTRYFGLLCWFYFYIKICPFGFLGCVFLPFLFEPPFSFKRYVCSVHGGTDLNFLFVWYLGTESLSMLYPCLLFSPTVWCHQQFDQQAQVKFPMWTESLISDMAT